jgi:hypothetical protein
MINSSVCENKSLLNCEAPFPVCVIPAAIEFALTKKEPHPAIYGVACTC